MSQKCEANCLEHPDAVDKINWKCVECKTDLKSAYDALIVKKEADREAKVKTAAEVLAASGELTEEQKVDRRSM